MSEELLHGDLVCDSQTFIAMLLCDPLMSALPILVTRRSQLLDCSPADRERELGFYHREMGSLCSLDFHSQYGYDL